MPCPNNGQKIEPETNVFKHPKSNGSNRNKRIVITELINNTFTQIMHSISCWVRCSCKTNKLMIKLMKIYLIRIQNSVFEGEITKAKFEEMKLKVNKIIDSNIDSVIFFKSRDIRWMDKDICGFEKDDTDNFL